MSLTKLVSLGGRLLAAGFPVMAQVTGPPFGVGAGANFRQDSALTLKGPGADTARAMGIGSTGKLGFDGAGPVVLGNLGWGFNNGILAEVEFSYRSNGVGPVSIAGYPAHPQFTGTTSTSAVMANLLAL